MPDQRALEIEVASLNFRYFNREKRLMNGQAIFASFIALNRTLLIVGSTSDKWVVHTIVSNPRLCNILLLKSASINYYD